MHFVKGFCQAKTTHPSINVLLLGPVKTGKTSIITRYLHNIFRESYSPSKNATLLQPRRSKVKLPPINVNKFYACVSIKLRIFDSSGDFDLTSNLLKELYYQAADIIILTFDISKEGSLRDLTQFWMPEVRSNMPEVPIILCGTHQDVRAEAERTCDQLNLISSLGAMSNVGGKEGGL